MKHVILVVAAILFVASMAFAQKQPLPTFKGGVQGSHAAMSWGPHDFTPDSGRFSDTTHPVGASKSLCRYCHSPHVPTTGIARPLWIRASRAGNTFGAYSNPTSLDVTVPDVGVGDNYSSFCMSCHDGSAMFTAAAYTEGSRPRASTGYSWTTYENGTVDAARNMYNGEFNLEHVHPVNFDYNAAVALDPQGIYAPVNASSYVVQVAFAAGTRNDAGTSTVRLFDGKMQCSSCHMPHMSGGIGLSHTQDYGKLCVSCHRK
jgi:predicted CXXCH cytochrome family protein